MGHEAQLRLDTEGQEKDGRSDESNRDRSHLAPQIYTDTHRGINSRQAQMIAIGGTIGTGLFVGAGEALAIAGPGFLFLAYGIICLLVYGVVTATIEISAYLPLRGCGMPYYGKRFVSPSFGFALGWMYVYTFSIVPAFEVTAASLVLNYWEGARSVSIAVWITVLLAFVLFINFLPVKIFGETEFWFAGLKVLLLLGLLSLSFILFWGGGPDRHRLGFEYWVHDATKEYLVTGSAGRFWAFLYIMIFSFFSFFFGPELIVATGGEMQNPRKNLPRASRHFIIRLLAFYFLSSLAIGVICDSNAPALTGGGPGAAASPWVVAIHNAGIGGLDSVVNAGILISAWSAGSAYLYMASRTLYGLAKAGDAPAIFTRCNRWGTPYIAVAFTSLFSLLAYLNVNTDSGKVFNWFVSLTNMAGFISWISCCIIYLRFRRARLAQGIQVPYTSWLQPHAAYSCCLIFLILLLFNGFSVFVPGNWSTADFLSAYIGLPAFLTIYAGHRLWSWRHPWILQSHDIDLTTGIDELDADEAWWQELDKSESSRKPLWQRLRTVFFD